MSFRIDRVTPQFGSSNAIEFIGGNHKLRGVIQMLRAHIKCRHLKVLANHDAPTSVKVVAQGWVDKIDTIDISISSSGMVSFDGAVPECDYYRILPVVPTSTIKR